ncbi:hypothetical protein G7Y89_g10372 [Cudoniella acicularis]|uniref:tRNA (adenine(58)-N(1))-methyltransferase catalytic subunit TRM61 n=1 Tax=Cudoniella acicularis TaxID=354080 RepID=A0A8H4RGM2_9HELO|nr:hypothetical protein G7Y89_g10372 [Cudoniella acicularis]
MTTFHRTYIRSIVARLLSSRVPVCSPCNRRLFSNGVIEDNDIVLLKRVGSAAQTAPILSPRLCANGKLKIDSDSISHDHIIGQKVRDVVISRKKRLYRLSQPSLAEYTDYTPRLVTPIYAQDASAIVSLLDIHPALPAAEIGKDEERFEIFEAGTGHGALTLNLARAIHAANTAPPTIPDDSGNVPVQDGETSDQMKEAEIALKVAQEKYDKWRYNRKAIIHTLDVSQQYSAHAQTIVRNFRDGIYFPHVDFHVGTIPDYISGRLEKSLLPFLDHAILDLPSCDDYIEDISKALKPNGVLLVFCPNITQINACVLGIKSKGLPLFLESAVELGAGSVGGREWDIRPVRTRAFLKAMAEEAVKKEAEKIEKLAADAGDLLEPPSPVDPTGTISATEYVDPLPTPGVDGWELVCRPKLAPQRVILNMTRRIVRTICQLAALTAVSIVVVYFLDNRFRVLPSALHNVMPAHHPGLVITDITVTTCSQVNLFTSCRLDADEWHRVEKDLYLGTGWVSSAYVHIKRKKEEELLPEDKVVVDVKVGRLDPSNGQKGEENERWESRPAGLWIKRSAKRHASDSSKAITAVDVLFGADAVDPRNGWQTIGTGLLLDNSGEIQEAQLSVRRGKPSTPPKAVPRINDNAKFKIMQVSDLHLSTGTGHCRDEQPVGLNGQRRDCS